MDLNNSGNKIQDAVAGLRTLVPIVSELQWDVGEREMAPLQHEKATRASEH